ncbi:MAG: hypothetical protein LQ349_008044 [Xanthoria aureola]|nr:MAG: hypothetical protein LQ349_008044 [Xanthoria aureola]
MERLDTTWARADAARERELYRYFDPPELEARAPSLSARHTLSVEHNDPLTQSPSSPENTLTALAQLCALRLNASRAMVSVIAKDTQYFIAEATKTLDLVESQQCEAEGDGLWVGCGSATKAGRLCEKTIELPAMTGSYPCFTVNDLSKDERFNQLPFVTGDPHFRFYVGTPLTTKNGVNIGSLFVLDTKVRPKLNPTQERFLGSIAATIMGHLEVNREAEERSKVLRMAKGLNAFVEGKGSFNDDGQSDDKTPLVPMNGAMDEIESTHNNIEGAHKATFSRAANLLGDSLNVREHGGVCFLDTTTGPRNVSLGREGTMETESESDAKDSPRKAGAAKKSDNSRLVHDRHLGDIKEPKRAEVIGFSGSRPVPLSQVQSRNADTFIPLEERFLQSLLKHYPRGKVWIFDGVEGLTSEEDDRRPTASRASEEQAQRRLLRKTSEKEVLQRCFPNVFELVFVPLWDAGSSRWFSGCFCWRTFINRSISIEMELQFIVAFSHSIMGEVSRLASLYESRQKGDFIGSISHELRSPLHGILASAEFLSETNFDAFQGNLVDTISSCGRTLLDTIEHILDFSKINSFERNWRNARKPKEGGRRSNNEAVRRSLAKEAPPLMSIYAVTDVAAIVEEVVEGVYAGQIYRDFGSIDIPDVSTSQREKTPDRSLPVGKDSLLGGSAEPKNAKRIEVVLDIAQEDYCFVTQPGALRRKYTLAGKIVVRLRLDAPENQTGDKSKVRILEITVTDTGKGISTDYLRTSLYTPFSQEDVLANGTGLGLSIVRSIVSMLEGTIDIKSQVGQGTEVQLRIPLKREAASDTPMSTPSSVGSPDKLQDNSISILQTEHPAKRVSIYCADVESESHDVVTDTSRMATYYVEHWLKLKTESDPLERSADVIVVEERHLPDLLKHLNPGPAVVVLCSRTHRLQAAESLYQGAIEFIATPFGPYKLAKAIRRSLEKAGDFARGVPQPPSKILTPQMSETETIVPEFESMTLETDNEETPIYVQTNGVVTASQSDNARMALGSSSSGASTESRRDFPFPAQSSNNSGPGSPQSPHLSIGDLFGPTAKRPKLSSRKTEPLFRPPYRITSTLTSQGALATSDARESSTKTMSPTQTTVNEAVEKKKVHGAATDSKINITEEKRSPRLLLVDDNKINLRLLETFMRKRKYEHVDSAMDGKLALEAAEKHEEGYDIIFMDLSMPVMNGFESTRAIREFERRRDRSKYARPPKAALIIALTGLASGRDHGEAFACGVDLYMTKPVSFKEVGRLLDNWEAHGGLEAPRTSLKDKSSERVQEVIPGDETEETTNR